MSVDFSDISARLRSAPDLASIQEIVRTTARALSGSHGSTLVLRDGDQCFYADEDAISPLWKGQRFPMTQCISGWAMLNAASVIVPDVYTDPRIPVEAYRPTFVKSLAAVPIGTEPIGVIGAYWAVGHAATPAEMASLQRLAGLTASALVRVAAII